MDCKIYGLNELKTYKYVVVLSKYKDKILLSRHRERDTWETQGGHIEEGETTFQAAERELKEECGAVSYKIKPIFDYWAGTEESGANGMVFFSEISELSGKLESEMEEVKSFESLPENLTYPQITPHLFKRLEEIL